jgi:signal peptidase II
MYKNGLILAVIIFTADRITKILALKNFSEQSIEVTPFFNLVLVWNRGISFGLFNNLDYYGPLILSIISLLIVGMLLLWLTTLEEKHLVLAVCSIISGALGNIIDRLQYGAVVDFLDFHLMGWHYPAFNIADSAIVLGIAFILFDSIFFEGKRRGLDQK